MLNRTPVTALFLALCSHAHAVVAQPMALPPATGEAHNGSVALVVNDAAASATNRLLHVSPWVRLATGFEWDTSPFALQILGKIDVSAYKTHYDIERNGNAPQPLASNWVIQPGIVVAALWR